MREKSCEYTYHIVEVVRRNRIQKNKTEHSLWKSHLKDISGTYIQYRPFSRALAVNSVWGSAASGL